MAKRVTTLFVRDTEINLLVTKGTQVERWASSPLEAGLVSQGLIMDAAQVADRIKQLFKETGAPANKVVTGLSGHDSLYRIITLPDVPEAVLPEAVRREAKRTMPTPLEEVYFSYQSLPAMKGERRIFLVTFPRNLVDALVETLRQAGVKPYSMDLAPLALCRIPNEPRAVVVNAWLDHLEVMVIADRIPEVVRRLSLPGEVESLEEKLPLIAEEFNRTVIFYNSSHVEKPLDATVPVFVCGELAEAPQTWQALVGKWGHSVAPLPPPVEVPEGFDANQFMVNIGLALKELPPDKERSNSSLVDFNALPEAYVPPGFSIVRVLIPVGIVLGIGAIIYGVILLGAAQARIETLRSEVMTVQARVTQVNRDISALKSEVGSLEASASALHARIIAIERGRAEMHEDLREINRLARRSDRVDLTGVTHGGASVRVTGTASDEDAAYRYARDLRQSGRFSTVWVPSIARADRAFSFTIELTK